jgi:hypothetical protein
MSRYAEPLARAYEREPATLCPPHQPTGRIGEGWQSA